jgi:hypothetical protein
MVLNLSSLQSPLSMIDGKRGTMTPHQIFLDEKLGLKTNPSKIRDHIRS